ncbi:hypothetical protein [Clostridium saccharoperbutylacetonicum]|uniref:hypothetical protein n=1 Tax=Clostridium saccharoperbutylacetonicum TaxID=36745 RepID=UPI000983E44A|nr:hypothetical protein [Clostridium saccharoperbutylacetonicum]AQR93355.1 hypothetical protein CLSAP_06530 [Clostridium saccharoperbutylacetonicum]AQR93364.1 hypothetical protein CLSAP_06620 [Clostridium saccharoperbutylacetonicum]NSB29061.1 Flp pilus assembly pilin Flp [Clostridium saccharoperbutylacetonicum]NSB34772.1 Flp pilus assembly pilin Flp [Clostridium saccharoperbutylacetonicum]NSB34785.1 Flp pilus assembly pilin Flp [Clostridium saccharoperbutylacetonicum]
MNIQEIKNQFNSVSTSVKAKAFTVGAFIGTTVLPVVAHAEDTTAGGLDPTVKTAITNGFSTVGTAIATIVGLGVVAMVGVVATSGGAKAGLKWIKGAFSKAS